MNKEILEKIIETRSVSFSYEEIQSLLDEELEKSPDEMDAELVDMCIEALENAEKKPPETPARKKLGAKKIILIAAIIAIMAVLALPVGAKVFKIEAAENAVEVFEDFIRIHFLKQPTSDIKKQFSDIGAEEIFIPSAFYSKNCVITSKENQLEDLAVFDFSFSGKDISGYFSISGYEEIYDEASRSVLVRSEAEIIKQLFVDKTEIFICLDQSDKIVVIYFYKDLKYKFCFADVTYEDVLIIFEEF